jgi:hypothetical protein
MHLLRRGSEDTIQTAQPISARHLHAAGDLPLRHIRERELVAARAGEGLRSNNQKCLMEEPSKKPKLTITERIAKLPKDIRDYVQNVERERDISVLSLAKWLDTQTPSGVSIEEYENGKFVTRYIQTDKVEFDVHGVKLVVHIGYGRDKTIKLSWGGSGSQMSLHHVAFVPTSFQQADLIAQENLR